VQLGPKEYLHGSQRQLGGGIADEHIPVVVVPSPDARHVRHDQAGADCEVEPDEGGIREDDVLPDLDVRIVVTDQAGRQASHVE
jgi:hypothetical protein